MFINDIWCWNAKILGMYICNLNDVKTLVESNLWWSCVRLEHGSTESAHDSLPRFAIERNIAKSGLSNHVCNTGTSAAPRARPGHRLAPLHFLRLIHQKTKANHACFWSNVVVVLQLNLSFLIFWTLSYVVWLLKGINGVFAFWFGFIEGTALKGQLVWAVWFVKRVMWNWMGWTGVGIGVGVPMIVIVYFAWETYSFLHQYHVVG